MNKKKLMTVLTHVALVSLSMVFIFPFLWLLDTAVKPINETMKQPPVWIPSKFEFNNFWEAINYGSDKVGYIPFLVYAENTVMLAILVVTGTVISNAVVAYSFARLRWPGRDLIFAITLATMMVPFPVLMVPTFTIFKSLGWVGTYRPLWVPAWFGSAFSIFLLRQFFKTIPSELSEAAKIDGAGEWTIFRAIVLPLTKPALSVVALFSFMGTWNDFMGPLIYLLRQETFTLSLGLEFYHSKAGGTQWNLLMAATCIVILPVLVVFFFCQKQFIKGISITGIK